MDSGRMIERMVDNIRKICKEKGVSIMQMEHDLGLSAGLISRWSKSKTSPSFDKIVDIMGYLDVTYDELMEGVRSRHSEKWTKSENGANKDDDVIGQLEKGSLSGDIEWERAGKDSPFEVKTDIIFRDMFDYDMHRLYYTAYKKGWFLYSVQYNEETMEVLVVVYMLTSDGMDLVRMEAMEEGVMKLLCVIDEEFFNRISQARADRMKEDFMKEDFMKEKFEGRYKNVS
ncbi:MAG: helix-turn-helix domain-containing protein [Butyrivibrio sp.]|nr:helix-turn-helix domain-containing protein [Butyrivibrio sp.]